MATLGSFADLSRYQAAAARPLVSPLDSAIQGFTQGQAIRNLPQTLQDQALNQQLARAVALQKLQQLGQPEIINAGGGNLYIRDATSPNGVRQVAFAAQKPLGPTISENLGLVFDYDANGRPFATKIPIRGDAQVPVQSVPLTSVFDQAPVQIPEFNLPSSIGLHDAAQAPQVDLTNLIESAVQQSGQPSGPAASPFVTGKLAQEEALRKAREASAAQIKEKDKTSDREFRTAERIAGQEFVTGRDEAKEKAKEAPPISAAYQEEASIRNLQSITDLKGRVGPFTTGLGSLLSNIPATDAADFEADLKTLKANIAFGELAAMRAASKTGGALGNVSNKETALLESTLGALDTKQSSPNFLKNLNKIEASVNRWKAAVAKGRGNAPSSELTRVIALDGSMVDIPTANVSEALKRGARLP